MKSATSLLLLLAFAGIGSACAESRASSEALARAAQSASGAVSTAKSRPVAVTSRIVFVDKEHGCECTTKRVDAAWSALHAALAGRQAPAVERLHVDTEPEAVAPYQQLRPMLAVPALYFVDQRDALVELLQGDVTTVQIQSVLGSETKPR